MVDVVGSAVYNVVAEFHDSEMQRSIAQGMDRTRDEMGRFVKEHRTVMQTVMADMGSVFSSGTSSAVSVMTAAMNRGADAAGASFTARIMGAVKALPGSIGSSLSSGLISTASAAMRSAGDAASEAFAERVRYSVPFWKKAFSQSFRGSADPAVLEMVSRTRTNLKGMGDAFTEAGIHAAGKLGASLANAANIILPSLQPMIQRAQDLIQTGFSKAGELGSTALSFATERVVPAITNVMTRVATTVSTKLSEAATNGGGIFSRGMGKAGTDAVEEIQKPFRTRLAEGLKTALRRALIGGAVLTVAATALGVAASVGLVAAFRKGVEIVKDIVTTVMKAATSGFVTAAKNVGIAGAKAVGDGLKSATSAILGVMGDIGKGAAKAMGDTLKLGVNAVGVSVAGILGTALTKGMGRLKAIDNAEAALRGLAATAGHVPEIMDAATAAVTGTAFGLDQAATAAGQFAAANIPVQDMERHLSSLANTAAGAGGDFDGMADIFSKVAAGITTTGKQGRVTGEVINQLTSRGVSGLNALAEHFDITTTEAQAMVKAGKVSFNDFSLAMDAAMGKAAIEQATTFQGLMMNVGAAMGRLGAVMQKPFFDATKAALPGVMNLFNQLTGIITPLATLIAERLIPFAEKLGESLSAIKFGDLNASADQLFGTLGVLAPVIGGIAAAFAGPLLTSIPVVGSLFSGLTGPVGILLGSLVALFALKPETLFTGMETVLGALPGIIDRVLSGMVGVLPKLAANFASNAPILIEGFTQMFLQVARAAATIVSTLIPVAVEAINVLAQGLVDSLPLIITAGLQVILGIAGALSRALPQIVPVAAELIGVLIQGIGDALGTLVRSAALIILALADGLITALPTLIPAAVSAVTTLVEALGTALPQIIAGGVELLLALVDGVVGAIPELIPVAVEAVMALVGGLLNALPEIVVAGLDLIVGLIDGIVQAIPLIIEALPEVIEGFLTGLIDNLPAIIEGGVELLLSLILGIVNSIPMLVTAVVELIPIIVTALVGALPELVSGAIQLFLGIVTGLIEATPDILVAVIDLIPAIVGALIDLIPEIIAAGADLIGGLVEGIFSMKDTVEQAISDIGTGIMNFFKGLFGINSPSTVFAEYGGDMMQGLIDGIDGLMSSVESILQVVSDVFTVAWDSIQRFVSETIENVRKIVDSVMKAISAAWTTSWNSIKNLVTNIMNGIRDTLDTVMTTIKGAWDVAWSTIKNLASTVMTGIRDTISNIMGSISSAWSSAWNGIKNAFQTISNTVKGIATSMWNGIRTTFNSVTSFLRGIPGTIKGFFSGIGSWLKNSGRALIDGFLDGIMAGFNWAKSKVEDGLASIRSLFPFSPAEEGPFSGRGWVSYAGQSLGETFVSSAADALEGGRSDISRSLGDLANEFGGLGGGTDSRDIGFSIASSLAQGLLDGRSEVERASGVLGGTIRGALSGFSPTGRITSLDSGSTGALRASSYRDAGSLLGAASAGGGGDSSRSVVIEAGAIQVIGNDPKRTSLDVLDRLVEELNI